MLKNRALDSGTPIHESLAHEKQDMPGWGYFPAFDLFYNRSNIFSKLIVYLTEIRKNIPFPVFCKDTEFLNLVLCELFDQIKPGGKWASFNAELVLFTKDPVRIF